MQTITIPKTNENQSEATLDRWNVREGERVAAGQALCHLITDKNDQELHAEADGVVLKVFATERSVLPVGYAVCVIGVSGDSVSATIEAENARLLEAHRGLKANAAATKAAAGAAPAATGAPVDGGGAVRATPAARRLAKELGVDLAAVAAAYKLTAPVGEKDVRRFKDESGK